MLTKMSPDQSRNRIQQRICDFPEGFPEGEASSFQGWFTGPFALDDKYKAFFSLLSVESISEDVKIVIKCKLNFNLSLINSMISSRR